MNALNILFLEIEKHTVMRAHASLVRKAKNELERLKRIEAAAEIMANRLGIMRSLQEKYVSDNGTVCRYVDLPNLFNSSDADALARYEEAVKEETEDEVVS